MSARYHAQEASDMPKKIKFESFVHRFLQAASDCKDNYHASHGMAWSDFINHINFRYNNLGVTISWEKPESGSYFFEIRGKFLPYTRGDTKRSAEAQKQNGSLFDGDKIMLGNRSFFHEAVAQIAAAAKFNGIEMTEDRHKHNLHDRERDFHDEWSNSEVPEDIDVCQTNEALTAPEMRYITKKLGDITDKRLLDIGCGLGEASVYFAIKGAKVTASDLSPGMIDFTHNLAAINGVSVDSYVGSADSLSLDKQDLFEIIYAGNVLHHVDMEETLKCAKRLLADNGLFVSWDPIAYNPIINIYRRIATDVRTIDEHPLKWRDIQLFDKYFSSVEKRYFWLSTLIIFIIMSVIQRRSPNKERFWKVVIAESDQWAWLYRPLEKLDNLLLQLIPPLRLLCWNVVVVCKK